MYNKIEGCNVAQWFPYEKFVQAKILKASEESLLTDELCNEIAACFNNSPLDLKVMARFGPKMDALLQSRAIVRTPVARKPPPPPPSRLEKARLWCAKTWSLGRDSFLEGLASFCAVLSCYFLATGRLLVRSRDATGRLWGRFYATTRNLVSRVARRPIPMLLVICALALAWAVLEPPRTHDEPRLTTEQELRHTMLRERSGMGPETCARLVRKTQLSGFDGPSTLLSRKAEASLAPDAKMPAPPPKLMQTMAARIQELEQMLGQVTEQLDALQQWAENVAYVVQGAVLVAVVASTGYAVLAYTGVLAGGAAAGTAAATLAAEIGTGLVLANAEA